MVKTENIIFHIALYFMLILFTSCNAYESEQNKGNQLTSIKIGDSKQVVTHHLQEAGYSTYKQLGENVLIVQYKPHGAFIAVKEEWINSNYEFIFENGILTEINWKTQNGTYIKTGMEQLYIGVN